MKIKLITSKLVMWKELKMKRVLLLAVGIFVSHCLLAQSKNKAVKFKKYTPINVGIKNFIKWFKDYYKF